MALQKDSCRNLKHFIESCISGESKDALGDSVIERYKILPSISEYQHKDIFNVNETSLFYYLIPNQTLANKGKKCKNGKKK